jgi:uncharacterized protein (TIGR02145 family)
MKDGFEMKYLENIVYVVAIISSIYSGIDGLSSAIDFLNFRLSLYSSIFLLFCWVFAYYYTKNSKTSFQIEGKTQYIIGLRNKFHLSMIAIFLALWLPILISADYSTILSRKDQLYSSFRDNNDNKKYEAVTINSRTWMAQNLNYNPEKGVDYCYDDIPANCDSYGRLYDWKTALNVCPGGWQLPSDKDFDELIAYLGGTGGAGAEAKAILRVLFSGMGEVDGTFSNFGIGEYYWCSADKNLDWGICYQLNKINSSFHKSPLPKEAQISVRCIKIKSMY